MTVHAHPALHGHAASGHPSSSLQHSCDCGRALASLGIRCATCEHEHALGLRSRLKLGRSDDPLEVEADRAATALFVSDPDDRAAGSRDLPRMTSDQAPLREPLVRRSTVDLAGLRDAPADVGEVLRSPGQPLAPATKAYFGARLGHDFSRVRIHSDQRAAESARGIGASAFTCGQDVVFAAGAYAPHSRRGRRLLAHELAHVVQQGARSDLVARAPTVPVGVPQSPAIPNIPPAGSRSTAPQSARAAASAVCPACACSADHVARIEQARAKAQAVLDDTALHLRKPAGPLHNIFEQTFGKGSGSAENIVTAAGRYAAAARFLAGSSVSDPPGSGNVHCDASNSTSLCAGGASAFHERGNIVICSHNPSPAQMLDPPAVAAEYKTEGTPGSTEGFRQVPDPGATELKQEASDAEFTTRLTAVLAHEAIHHAVQPGVVDVYTNERLFSFLGGASKGLDADLSPLALQNPDSLVLFAFRSFVMSSGGASLQGTESALAAGEKLSGKLAVRPLLGRKRARLGASLAEEAIEQARERLDVLRSEVASVQGGPSSWSLFPSLSQQLVQSLASDGGETDFAEPDAAALTRLQTIVDAFTRLSDAIRDKKIVLGRRFLQDKPASRIEVAIPDWQAFRKMDTREQLEVLLGVLLDEEPDIAGLDEFVLELARSRGGMGNL